MELSKRDFAPLRVWVPSIRKAVFNNPDVMRSFEWMNEHKYGAAFKLSSQKISSLQALLVSDSVDWRLFFESGTPNRVIESVWIESDQTGWQVWPVSLMLDELGSAVPGERLFIAEFNLSERPETNATLEPFGRLKKAGWLRKPPEISGYPFVGYLDLKDLSDFPTCRPDRRYMTHLIKMVVSKASAKQMSISAAENGGDEALVQKFVRNAAAESVGSFLCGFLLAFAFFSLQWKSVVSLHANEHSPE